LPRYLVSYESQNTENVTLQRDIII